MGLFGRKKDFWDEMDTEAVSDPREQNRSSEADDDFQEELDDGGWHPTKSTPIKAAARIFLFIAAAAMVISGFSVYTYFSNGGSWSREPDYYQSSYFGEEYNRNVIQLLHLVDAVEKRGEVPQASESEANETLIKNYMSAEGNFSFAVYDENDDEVIVSSVDAVKRIETSHYFVKLDSTEGQFRMDTGVENASYQSAQWREELMALQGGYTIYVAVDNELTSMEDGFYSNYQEFKQVVSGFGLTRIMLIGSAVVFLALLIFCIIATGSVKGYMGIQLTWFDKIFTEIGAILSLGFGGASVYGAYFMYHSDYGFRVIGAAAFMVLAYIFLARGYFSLVRRIKAGTFIENMVFYRLFNVIGTLPTVPKILLILLVLVLLNGALILVLFKLDFYEVLGIPLVYILVPIIFVVENICFISWVIRRGSAEYDDEDAEDEEADETEGADDFEAVSEGVSGDTQIAGSLEGIGAAIGAASVTDWEHMDLGSVVDEAIQNGGANMEAGDVEEDGADRTMLLPKDELESLLGAEAMIHDSATSFDFIQLNKDIRKLHRSILKANGVAVTLRTPDKPIIIEMNREDMWKAISMIYDNLEQYAEADSRVYAEMYIQEDKLIYIVKNAVKAEALEAAKAIVAPEAELSGGLKIAKEIVEKNQGKFVVAMDGNIFKTGMLLSMKQE